MNDESNSPLRRRLRRWALGLAAAWCGAAGGAFAAPPGIEALPAPAATNPARVELGRHLFFETRLSGDGSRSCASCHIPELGFTDGQPLSRGYHSTEYFRNAPGLLSVRLRPRLMWDGRHGELLDSVREMALDGQFMNGNAGIIAERIRQIAPLYALWQRAFESSQAPTGEQAFVAIAEFLRTLDHGETAVDRALRGGAALPAQSEAGRQLFVGKAGCVRCHNGPLLSDGQAHRLGVPENPAVLAEPLRTISLLRYNRERGLPQPMQETRDLGAGAVSHKPAEYGAFVTPSLRDLRYSGPYLHNGVLDRLEAVVDFHLRGGGTGSELEAVALSEQERAALLAFLRELSAPLPVVAEPMPYNYDSIGRKP